MNATKHIATDIFHHGGKYRVFRASTQSSAHFDRVLLLLLQIYMDNNRQGSTSEPNISAVACITDG